MPRARRRVPEESRKKRELGHARQASRPLYASLGGSSATPREVYFIALYYERGLATLYQVVATSLDDAAARSRCTRDAGNAGQRYAGKLYIYRRSPPTIRQVRIEAAI